MRPTPLHSAILTLFLLGTPVIAQRAPHDPLTPAQANQIAEASIDPPLRVGLYTKFLNEHADEIKALAKRADTRARSQTLAGDLEDFADLMDELGSNLDVYSDRKADIRKALKPLSEAIERWQTILKELPSEPGFDLERTDAMDSSNDLADQTKQLIQTQDAYFKEHKDQKGQQRAEPQLEH
jgi:ABC-type transporter Mla subunit MlaD